MTGVADWTRRGQGWGSILIGLVMTMMAAPTASAQRDRGEPPPLARYIPAEGLTVLLEHDGLHAHPAAWTGSATYKILNETSLGAMLKDITTQVIDYGLRSAPAPVPLKAEEAVGLLTHLLEEGFAISYGGTFNPPQPKSGVAVIRNAGKNPAFRRLLAAFVEKNQPFVKPVETPGGRKVSTVEGAPVRWWFEGDDFALSYVAGADDPVVATLEGKSPSALTLPTRTGLRSGEPGYVAVGTFFLDLSSMPPMPPDAVKLGLDGIKAVEASWGINGKATVTMIGVRAPRPRRGLLDLFNQPPIGASTRFNLPPGADGFTLVSIKPERLADTLLLLVQQGDPNAAASVARFAQQFRARTGISLRDDLAAKLGPRMVLATPGMGSLGNFFGIWFSPPEFGLVAELNDPQGFQATLDKLMVAANREMRAAGAMVRPQPGEPRRSGTEFAEFRRLKPPGNGYVLAVPPSVLPLPAGFRPTVIVDASRGVVTFSTSPATARRVSGALILNAVGGPPIAGRDAVVLSQSDPTRSLPEFLAALPSLRPDVRRRRVAGWSSRPVARTAEARATPVPPGDRPRRDSRRRGDAALPVPIEADLERQ